MVSRYDAVLAAIPALALGGILLERTVHLANAAVGVGETLSLVPFATLGLVAALAVIGRELLVVGVPAE